MDTRPLTREEAKRIRATYASQLPRPWWRWFQRRDLQALGVIVLAGTLLSTPIAALLFLSARYWHDESLARALHIGTLGFAPGAALAAIFFLMGWIGANRGSLPEIARDLKLGQCRLRRYRCQGAWALVDCGNHETPDLLLDLGKGRLLAIPGEHLAHAAAPAQELAIAELPGSGVTVEVQFSGPPLPINARAVVTDCLWRNDDLPWAQPFSLNKAPAELKRALAPAE